MRDSGEALIDFFQTYYQWVHLSCVFWIPELWLPFKAPVKISKTIERRTKLSCIICQ